MPGRIAIFSLYLVLIVTNGTPAWSRAIAADAVQETSHLQFVKEYLRELSEVERLRQRASDDVAANGNNMADCVRNMTSLKLELQSQVVAMRGIALRKPFDDLPSNIARFYEAKADLYGQFGDACSAMIAGPVPGVDYQAVAGNLPKLTAQIDYIDHALFEASPLVFATLLDDRADSAGHVSHLSITNAERRELLNQISTEFGEKLDVPQSGYLVASAAVVNGYLKKDFKGADDPW